MKAAKIFIVKFFYSHTPNKIPTSIAKKEREE